MKRILHWLLAALLSLLSSVAPAQMIADAGEPMSYVDMEGFIVNADRLPWENAQATPDLLALSTTRNASPRWVFTSAAMSFQNDLITTLVPQHSQGDGTPTFTRATTAYQQDFEGKQNLVLANEARMQGSRRVYNFVGTSSRDVTSGYAFNNIATHTFNSSTGKSRLVPLGANSQFSQSRTLVSGNTYTLSATVESNNGASQTFNFYLGSHTGPTVTATTTAKRFSYTVASTVTGAVNVSWLQTDNAGDFLIYGWQIEDVTGQANQNPSEYVSVGVLSAPYHGAGVDGVKYFSTLNGNTVASNVVTEATGAAIVTGASGVSATAPVDAGGPFGYLAEGARTNAILQSNTLGTTWTVSNAADMNAVAADAYVSTDGTTTMDKLQPKATTAVHSLDQAFTFTAAKYTTCADFRYVSATPQRWVAIINNDGTTTWGASFDLLNGVVGAVSAGATSTIKATGLANVYRACTTNTANAAAAAGTVKISLNATDTATLESAARAGTETLGVGFVQHEIGTFASTYIPTTTVAVTRNADVLTYALTGNIDATKGSAYAEVASAWTGTSALRHDIVSSASGTPLYVEASAGKLSVNDGAARLGNVFTGAATVQKVGSIWGGAVANTYITGTASSDLTFDGDMSMTTALHVGDNNGGTQWDGTIRNLRVWLSALSSSQMTTQTAFNEAFMPYRVAWAEAANDDEYRRRANR